MRRDARQRYRVRAFATAFAVLIGAAAVVFQSQLDDARDPHDIDTDTEAVAQPEAPQPSAELSRVSRSESVPDAPVPAAAPIEVIRGRVRHVSDGGPCTAGSVVLRASAPPFVRIPGGASITGEQSGGEVARTAVEYNGTFELRGANLAGYLGVLSDHCSNRDLVYLDGDASSESIEIWTVPGGRVVGVVSDSDGNPLPGADVVLRAEIDLKEAIRGSARLRSAGTETDVDGSFLFPSVPAGVDLLCRVDCPPWSPVGCHLRVDPGHTRELRLTMVDGPAVRGRVVDPSGHPVAGAEVRMHRRVRGTWDMGGEAAFIAVDANARCDADGRFVVRGLSEATYDLFASATDLAPSPALTLRVPAVGLTLAEPVMLRTGEPISGRVIDDRGDPVVGADVGFYIPPKVLWMEMNAPIDPEDVAGLGGVSTKTNERGEFRSSPLLTGDYDVTASRAGMELGLARDVAAGTDGVELTVRRGGGVAGVVLSEDGDLVTRYRVIARLVSGGSAMVGRADRRVEAIHRRDGTFELGGLVAGRWSLAFDSAGFGQTLAETVDVKPGDVTRGVIVRLPPESALRGVVVDAATQRPISGVRVWLPSAVATVESSSDALGRFELRGIGPGEHRVSAELDGYLTATIPPLALARGATRDDVRVELSRGGVIRGTVRDYRGQRCPRVVVHLIGAGDLTPTTARTDGSGSYEFAGLAGGSYIVTLQCDGVPGIQDDSADEFSSRTVSLELGGTEVVDFGPALAGVCVAGRVSLKDQPLSRALVQFAPRDDAGHADRVAQTDAAGSYGLDGLPSGSWSVRVVGDLDGRGAVLATFVAQIPAGRDHRLDLEVPGGGVSGRVIDGVTRRCVAGVRVAARDPDRPHVAAEMTTVTDDRGEFAFFGFAPGGYDLSAQGAPRGVDGVTYAAAPPTRVLVIDGQLTRDVELIVTRGGSVTVSVVDERDAPMRGAAVIAIAPDGEQIPADATSDERGEAIIGGLAEGQYVVAARLAGRGIAVERDVLVQPGRSAKVTLRVVAGGEQILGIDGVEW